MEATRRSLALSGWSDVPRVVLDEQPGPTSMARLSVAWRRVIRLAAQAPSDFVLLLEDDLIFGRWFSDNLRSWPPLQARPLAYTTQQLQRRAPQLPPRLFYGSLYNHGRGMLRRESDRSAVADPVFVWGSQAQVMTPLTAAFIDANWDRAQGNADVRMVRLAAYLSPVYFHVPSLVDHAPGPSTWCLDTHRAVDFDAEWRA